MCQIELETITNVFHTFVKDNEKHSDIFVFLI